MSISYLSSNNVNVFPSAHRVLGTGKFTSEYNFINILNSLTDVDSYVLSYDVSTKLLKVIIHGYYFEIKDFNLATKAFLEIRVETGSNKLVNYLESSTRVDELDKDGEFEGIRLFIDTNPTGVSGGGYMFYNLQVCQDNEIINRFRFNTKSILYNATDSVDLQSKLNSIDNLKQDNVSVKEDYLKWVEDEHAMLSISDKQADKLDSLNNKGNNTTLVYFNSNGEATVSSGNVGKKASSGNLESTSIVLSSGVLSRGQSITASTSSPSDSVGEIGDIWFKYTA